MIHGNTPTEHKDVKPRGNALNIDNRFLIVSKFDELYVKDFSFEI